MPNILKKTTQQDPESIPRMGSLRERLFPKKLRNFLNALLKRSGKKNIKNQIQSKISDDIDSQIQANIDSFASKTVDEIMIPRSDIVSVSSDISLDDLSKSIIKHTHTRTLVYKERLDNIIGFVHIKDLFTVVAKKKKFNLKKLMRKHIVCPHSMKLVDLLAKMQVNRTHIAVIVDEYGGTDGIVTIEDIIEEIVGKIDDEHDIDLKDENYRIIRPGVAVVNARAPLAEIEDALGRRLLDDKPEIETLGGLVMSKSGSVPEVGTVIVIKDDISIEVLESTARTLKQLKVTYSEE